MQRSAVNALNRGFISFLLLLFLLGGLMGCGSKGGGASSALSISLVLPADSPEDLFWYGVSHKKLRYYRGTEFLGEHEWAAQGSYAFALEAGERVIFQAEDSQGRVLARGEAILAEEKNISIMLYRLL